MKQKLLIGIGASLLTVLVYFVFAQFYSIPSLFGNCIPSPVAIQEPIYHHTFKPCTNFIDEKYIDRIGVEHKLKVRNRISINSLGFRNNSYSLKKTKGTRRIILLGDSFVYGYALDLKDTFFKHLEARLNDSFSKKIEVWNIGVTSWSTIIQNMIVRDKIRHYGPDLLILFLDNTDYFDNAIYEQYAQYNADGVLVSLEDPNHEDTYTQRQKYTMKVMAQGGRCESNKELLMLFDKTIGYLKKIDSYAQEMNIPFVVVNYPYPHEPREFHQYGLKCLRERILSKGINFLDLTPMISDVDKKNWYFYQSNLHWNEQGSIEIAKLLETFIIRKFHNILN